MPKRVQHRTLLAARGLGCRVGGAWLWREVDVALGPGEILGVAGPSGSGKSMLLRTLAGLRPADAGTVESAGEPAGTDPPRHRARVTYLHQTPAFAETTVVANLAHPFRFAVHAGRRFDRAEATAWLERLGRPPSLLDRPAGDLSGGERQSIALVRALLLAPRVLLLDEPTAALDAASRDRTEAALIAWAGEPSDGGQDPAAGRAMVWVAHDVDQLGRVATDRLDLGAA